MYVWFKNVFTSLKANTASDTCNYLILDKQSTTYYLASTKPLKPSNPKKINLSDTKLMYHKKIYKLLSISIS